MSESKRVYHSAETKVFAIKRHLINKENISDICNDLGIHPNVYHDWQSKFFSEGEQVFSSSKETKNLHKKVEKLSSKAQQKDTVISELVTELIEIKKKTGEN